MMLTNATLISWSLPAAPDANGNVAAATEIAYPPSTLCCVDEPTRSQLMSLANKVTGMTGIIYVQDLAQPPMVGSRVKYLLDGQADPQIVEVLHRKDRVHDFQTHVELAVKGV